MKNTTTQKRNVCIVAILAAAIMCLVSVAGFAMNRTRAHADVLSGDTVEIGISTPNNEYYNRLTNSICSSIAGQLLGNYNVSSTPANGSADQIGDINEFISSSVDIIIVAPIDSDMLASVLNDAYDSGIQIIVIGDYNDNYPHGITYISQLSYYDLGVKYAYWVCENYQIGEEPVIYVFYYDNINGNSFYDGIRFGLEELYNVGNAKFIEIYDSEDAGDYISDWLNNNPNKKIDEIVTYSNDASESVLESYYAAGYSDSYGYGTGIRAFTNVSESTTYSEAVTYSEAPEDYEEEVDNYFAELGNTIVDTMAAILAGAVPPNAVEVNGSYVIYNGFVPAYAKYVSR